MITFIAAWYYDDKHKYVPVLPISLQAQTYPDWELILLHDGPVSPLAHSYCEFFKTEPRIRFIETPRRLEQWGHPLRELGYNYISDDSDFIIHTNADNYYLPTFLNEMIKTIRPQDVGIFCDCLHSHHNYKDIFKAKLCRAGIDLGCMMFRTRVAMEAGFKHRNFEADWEFFEEVVERYSDKLFGDQGIAYLMKPLFVHN